MCGIIGFWDNYTRERVNLAKKMINRIKHRGPDNNGVWCSDDSGLTLAHVRLSIQDLSVAGHQPMVSDSSRYIIIFNGEIYNHLQMRKLLKKDAWQGHSDTETLLAGFEEWGIENTIKKSIGMFAIAVWDKQKKTLSLIRDRIGEKPLYYGWQKGTFLFGSELKSMRVHPSWVGAINRNSITQYLRYNCIPGSTTIYTDIFKLDPGTIQLFKFVDETQSIATHKTIRYWDPVQLLNSNTSFTSSAEELVNQLDTLLSEVIEKQMVSDVPLGSFLSGGIDSSLITALMQKNSRSQINTFSIGFEESEFDEAPFARAISNHLGTKHTDIYVSDSDARNVIPEIPLIWDEPFSDSSQIPTLLLSRLTKKFVTVSLSGDAGDELFGGYNRYIYGPALWNKLRKIPLPLRKFSAVLLNMFPIEIIGNMSKPIKKLAGSEFRDKVQKVVKTLNCRNEDDLYTSFRTHWPIPEEIVIGDSEHIIKNNLQLRSTLNFEERMMLYDICSYLPDDILVKVDRAAMSASLETRVPFLDHRVIEFAWSIPLHYKIRNGQGKWILRQVLNRYVPEKLFDRPKKGFGVPLAAWLRKPLREWAESLLSEEKLKNDGFFNPKPIRKAWSDHILSKRNLQYQLWDILMFQTWLDEQKRQQQ